MIDALKKYHDKYNKDVSNKLLLEVNVHSNEYDLLYNSLLFDEKWVEIQEEVYDVIHSYHEKVDTKNLESILKTFQIDIKSFDLLILTIAKLCDDIEKQYDKNRNTTYKLRKWNYYLEEVKSLVASQIIVINGDGATGKTHMLTKMCNDMLEQNKPTIIFYGHMISKIDDFIESINKKTQTTDFINEIATYAESMQQEALLIYDALNETRVEDKAYVISKLLSAIKGKNIKLIISYRNGDIEQSVEGMLDVFPSISLFGFSDYMEAAVKFAEHFNVDINEILEIDFDSNPLMLKVFCENYKKGNKEKGQRGTRAATFYYESYFKEVIKKIFAEKHIKKKDGSVFPQIKIWNIIDKESARIMVVNFRNHVTSDELSQIINSCDLNVDALDLIDYFTMHRLFERYISYHNDEILYRFSFQKISDFLIVRYLMNEKKETQTWKEYFSDQNLIKYLNKYKTILETLVEELPPRCDHKEIFEIIDTTVFDRFCNTYLRGLKYRSAHSLGKDIKKKQRTILDYLKENEKHLNLRLWYELILSVMIIPFHPINYSSYISNLFLKMNSNERDIFLYRFEREHYDYQDRFLSLLKIPYYTDINNLNQGFIINLAHSYLWLLSVPNRELRDKATKALSSILYRNFGIFSHLTPIVASIDDQYMIERFLAASYSAVTLSKNSNHIKQLYYFCEQMYFKEVISNIRIKHYLNLIISLSKKIGIEHNAKLIKPVLELNTYNPKKFEVLTKNGLEYSNVYLSLFDGFGDFSSYVIKPHLGYFEYYDKGYDEKIQSEYKKFYEELNDEKAIVDVAIKDPYSYEDLNKLSSDTRKMFDFYRRQLNSISNKRISIDTLSSTILKKMLDLGYGREIEKLDQDYPSYYRNQSRHDHRNERLGKKYQWIAYFELLGECFENLELKHNYYHYHNLISLDIDAMQFLNNKSEIYDFNFEYQKLFQTIDYGWEKHDFVKNFDTVNYMESVFEIEFNHHQYIPLYLYKNMKNELKDQEVVFRVYSFEGNKENIKAIPESIEGLTVYNQVDRLYEFNLEEINEGVDDQVYQEEINQNQFINQVKECYVESEYDYSNIDITRNGKNRTYYMLPLRLISKMNIRYDYAGIYRDDIGIAAIQNPFESNDSYLYIRKDIADQFYDALIYGIYSEKTIKNDSLAEKFILGSEYDAIYIYQDKLLKKHKLVKRRQGIF